MAPPSLPDLSPVQVVGLFDALLANADVLLNAAATLLDAGPVALARSVAILGLEESGKAIALHERRVAIAFCEEGSPFVDKCLRDLWGHHAKKLMTVYTFLTKEKYWFGTGPPEVGEEFVLQAIKEWSSEKNRLKQHGFYVDVDETSGAVRAPQDMHDVSAVAQVIERVHQIGWQLRLGQHIEAKAQADHERGRPSVPEEEIAVARELLTGAGLPAAEIAEMVESMRAGDPGSELHNDAYRYFLSGPGSSPFENVGKPGYEAQDRELQNLWPKRRHGLSPGADQQD